MFHRVIKLKAIPLFLTMIMFLVSYSLLGSESIAQADNPESIPPTSAVEPVDVVRPEDSQKTHYTYLIVHGASGGGWDWRTMDELLSAEGHTVYRPTLTGLGEKMHLASPDINLTTHINDIVNVILFENLQDLVLVGHSYAGFVITGVMNRLPERIQHAIFLDAAVPEDGMSAQDLWETESFIDHIEDGQIYFSWLDPNAPIPGDVPQSLKTFTEAVTFNHPDALKIPATYIAFLAPGQTAETRAEDASWQNAEARGWTIKTLDSDHNAQRSHPKELAELLETAPGEDSATQ